MPLNIKDEDVHRDARRLAELTGQSITGAVREAVAERLRALERERKREKRTRDAAAILAAARDCKVTLGLEGHSSDHEDLYGADGLPL